MTLEHRKAEILNQMFQGNVASLIASLATVIEENETLRAKLTELEKPKPADAPAP